MPIASLAAGRIPGQCFLLSFCTNDNNDADNADNADNADDADGANHAVDADDAFCKRWWAHAVMWADAMGRDGPSTNEGT